MKALFLLFLLAICPALHAQLVDVIPTGYTSTVNSQVNYGNTWVSDWRIESIHTETLTTNSLAITHHVNSTTVPVKGPKITSSVYEDRWYYSRVGPGVWAPLYGEHVTYVRNPLTGKETATVTVVDTSNEGPLTWFPTKSGQKTEGSDYWKTITNASPVELKVINHAGINAQVRIGCWWNPNSPTVNGFGTYYINTLSGQTKVVYLAPSEFSTFLNPVSFIEFDVDNYGIEPL